MRNNFLLHTKVAVRKCVLFVWATIKLCTFSVTLFHWEKLKYELPDCISPYDLQKVRFLDTVTYLLKLYFAVFHKLNYARYIKGAITNP
jgi:hypothetical protein